VVIASIIAGWYAADQVYQGPSLTPFD
jgi:hypothetical protein